MLQHVGSRTFELAEVPEPACRRGGVLVRNHASVVSAGTERTLIDFANRSLLGKARQRPDLARKVIDMAKREGVGNALAMVRSRLGKALPLGYSCAGVVEEVAPDVTDYVAGDRVACAGMGSASHAELVFVPKNLTVPIPTGVSFEDAAYVTLGAIALQGVRVATPTLGEVVAVIGLGLLGQLTVQLLKASGCRVVAIDLDCEKVGLAASLGADLAIARGEDVQLAIAGMTNGVGVDAVIVTAAADSNDPIELAGEISRDRGRVSMVGAVGMDIPRKVYYEKELELRLSRSYGPGRYDPSYEDEGRDYPIGYVRWTERRNMEAFLRFVASGHVQPSRLTTHRFPIADAESAYGIVTGERKERFSGIVLTYPDTAAAKPARTLVLDAARRQLGANGIGFIGAGNFAGAVLLPRFKRIAGSSFVGIATANGATAKAAAQRFGFKYATTDTTRLIEDPSIGALVIATRHGSHASLAARALRAGKSVFLEKPLAIDEAGLTEVLDAARESRGVLAVGFNRRFSPYAELMRASFKGAGPLAISYRVNAGAIKRDSWVHDPNDGGGRIIGETCHFVDFVQSLTGAHVTEVFAQNIGGVAASTHDTITASLKFSDGSIASINYFATGDKRLPKERVEVFGGGRAAVLEDYRELTVWSGERASRTRSMAQKKGFDEEIALFLQACRDGGPAPVPIDSLVATTRATFALEQSLRCGAPVSVDA